MEVQQIAYVSPMKGQLNALVAPTAVAERLALRAVSALVGLYSLLGARGRDLLANDSAFVDGEEVSATD